MWRWSTFWWLGAQGTWTGRRFRGGGGQRGIIISSQHSEIAKNLYSGWAVAKFWVPIRRATQKSDSVSGFGFRRLKPTFRCRFRVSGFVAWNQLSVSGFGFRTALGKLSLQSRFRVSGFGFRRLKSLSVSGFGFRTALGKLSLQSRFRVSGFGFRRLKPTFAVGSGFRVSGFERPWGS